MESTHSTTHTHTHTTAAGMRFAAHRPTDFWTSLQYGQWKSSRPGVSVVTLTPNLAAAFAR